MSNEDFQALVLEKLTSLDNSMKGLETEVKGIKVSHDVLARKIDVVCEQTAILTEFKIEVSDKLDIIIEDNKIYSRNTWRT